MSVNAPSTPLWKYPLRLVRKVIQLAGYELVSQKYLDALPTDPDDFLLSTLKAVRPYSMATNHRLSAMADAVKYVAQANIEGAVVECGVWRGANMMLAARVLLHYGSANRHLYLYDTFEGMSEPGSNDKDFHGVTAENRLSSEKKGTGVWCEASLEDVTQNMATTGYPQKLIHYAKGMVESTIPTIIPDKIAILRLDTDWYESTKHELVHLYPLLVPGGVLLIDDYGHWMGSRQATNEYFNELGIVPMLQRIDFSCRAFVKLA